ncbi:LysR family transcriptional regulator [Rhodobacteraceae bacterium B1Z28]|uniref:LysR family transcriptional regulator n=1 Tax=Ruegeria haliotis TaxID=2747601 RepID=A0ABX2PQK1_9RHOB|nr:LysR substrate-binding domain-containing protein [Ruegeria haliotis]NVO56409.1 LysR family transcriptional regulator [Ruegeria haliotis]
MKRGTLPLNALRAFEATVRHGQMKLAADELGVTYGAISRQVRGLEDVLGVQLFDGPRNKLVPTQAALDLQPALQTAFDGIEQALDQVVNPARRVLDVSCLSTFSMRWLIPRLFDFQERHQDIEVRLTADDGPVDFTRQRHDLAIRVGAGPWDNAQAMTLFEDRVGPVLSPDLIKSGAIKSWEELSDLPVLHTKTRQAAWLDWCAANDHMLPSRGREFEHFYFLLEAATAGLGVAIAPEVLVSDDLRAGRLIAPFGFQPSGQVYVCLHPDQPSKDVIIFLEWLSDSAKDRLKV